VKITRQNVHPMAMRWGKEKTQVSKTTAVQVAIVLNAGLMAIGCTPPPTAPNPPPTPHPPPTTPPPNHPRCL